MPRGLQPCVLQRASKGVAFGRRTLRNRQISGTRARMLLRDVAGMGVCVDALVDACVDMCVDVRGDVSMDMCYPNTWQGQPLDENNRARLTPSCAGAAHSGCADEAPFEPTLSPSRVPSAAPSLPPSILPSLPPSLWPSRTPSFMPTQPVAQPTGGSTDAPLAMPNPPTAMPSEVPSATPSTAPSVTPSLVPTMPPSAVPSLTPSAVGRSECALERMSCSNPCDGSNPAWLADVGDCCEVTYCAAWLMEKADEAGTTCTKDVATNLAYTCYAHARNEMCGAPICIGGGGATLRPSHPPTAVPTVEPSMSPSLAPSLPPSASPTVQPSVLPTASPSAVPTTASQYDSLVPTATPSRLPSADATLPPSMLQSV